MTVGPRVVFTRFGTSDSPKLMPWLAHTKRVLGPAIEMVASPAGGDGAIVWQVVSANNRQLARGVVVHDTYESARATAAGVVADALALEVTLVSEESRGVLGWFASLPDGPVIMGARWYATQRDRRYAIELALRSVAVATLQVGARLSDPALMAGPRVADY